MSQQDLATDLEKLGGVTSALTIIFDENKDELSRETAALVIANASRKDEKVCYKLLGMSQSTFKQVVELLWDDNSIVCKNCLRLLTNCTFVNFEGNNVNNNDSLRPNVARFVQETDWISSLLSIVKSDPQTTKKPGEVVMSLNSLANLALEFVPVKAIIFQHDGVALLTNLLSTKISSVAAQEAALNALINCLEDLPKSVRAFQLSCGFTRLRRLFETYLSTIQNQCSKYNETHIKKKETQSKQPSIDLILILIYQCFLQGDITLCNDVIDLGLIFLLAKSLSLQPPHPIILPNQIRNLILKCIQSFFNRIITLTKGLDGTPSIATKIETSSNELASISDTNVQMKDTLKTDALMNQLWQSKFLQSAHMILCEPSSWAMSKTTKDRKQEQSISCIVKQLLCWMCGNVSQLDVNSRQYFVNFLAYGATPYLLKQIESAIKDTITTRANTGIHDQASKKRGSKGNYFVQSTFRNSSLIIFTPR